MRVFHRLENLETLVQSWAPLGMDRWAVGLVVSTPFQQFQSSFHLNAAQASNCCVNGGSFLIQPTGESRQDGGSEVESLLWHEPTWSPWHCRNYFEGHTR